MQVPFDVFPFILLSTREYQCHQGKDKNVTKKLNREKINTLKPKLCSDHPQHIKKEEIVSTNQKTSFPCQVSRQKKLQISKVCYNKRQKTFACCQFQIIERSFG